MSESLIVIADRNTKIETKGFSFIRIKNFDCLYFFCTCAKRKRV